MPQDFWHKQTDHTAVYPDILWDKPESKLHAGKLLIIGGNAHSFTAPASAYAAAEIAGIGSAKVLLPDILRSTIGATLENGEYAPTTKSGSFSKQALASWLDFAAWSDGVLLPGDLGRNSETAILLEKFVGKYPGNLTLTKDALDYFTSTPLLLLDRSETIMVTNFASLQKMATNARFPKPFTYDMPINTMVEQLHLLTTIHSAMIVLNHNGIFYVAQDGDISTTKTDQTENLWRVETAAAISVWCLQHPAKSFAAATTAIFTLTSNKKAP